MNKGFSLVELIVVIAIMAILVGVAVPVYTSYIEKANDATDIQAIDNLEHACKIVSAEYSVDIEFDTTGSNITATVTGTKAEAAITQLALILGDAATEDEGVFTVALNAAPLAYGAENNNNKPQIPADIDG